MNNSELSFSRIISVIIPIRVTSSRKDILERLEFCFDKKSIEVEYLVVDDGSSLSDAITLEQRCLELGYRYISTNVSTDKMFNLARARNVGAKQAKGKYLLFLDVDLITYPGFYSDIITEIELQDLAHNSDIFLMFPVVYLNDRGLHTYFKLRHDLKKHFASQVLIEGWHDLIEKYSYGTSSILVDRLYYLTIGGQNENFEGWGYEDYDFTIKMMKLSSKFPTPSNFASMKGNFMNIKKYSGWKAEYRLFGMWMARKNIYLYHAPHEIDSSFKSNEEHNLELLENTLSKDYDSLSIQTIKPHSNYSLLLSKNPFCCHYKLNIIVGNYEVLDIKNISDWTEIKEYYLNNDLSQIVFPNPYGNENLLKLYMYCRTKNIPYLVCERGALPGSIYHDKNGFLYDSSSYSTDKWDIKLKNEQRFKIEKYLTILGKGQDTLEEQPNRLSRNEVLLNLCSKDDHKKIVLIVLQTKDDTVIKFFGRTYTSQAQLKDFIENTIRLSADKYHYIYKNHPLEPSKMTIDGATNADCYHINDLVDLCDAVLTVNSGAGLIAAFLNKPVFTLGDSWYTMDGIACNIRDENDFLSKIESFNPSREKVLRFAYFLRYRFYSFGKQHTKVHVKQDSIINATYKIDYTEVQTSSYGRIYFRDKEQGIGFNSSLFKEYEEDSFDIASSSGSKFLHVKKLFKNIFMLVAKT